MAAKDVNFLTIFDSKAFRDSITQINHSVALLGVLTEVSSECSRQVEKWGIQHHPDGTGPGYGRDVLTGLGANARVLETLSVADIARKRADEAKGEALTWEKILTEEFFEALEEEDLAKLRVELIQVAAVAVSWIADIDREES